MKKLKIPRYIQWIALIGLFLLFIMFLLRLAFVIGFAPPYSFQDSLLTAFFLGLRYDFRIVGALCLLLFLLGSIPFLHPIQKKTGKRISYFIISLFLIVLAFLYAIDFANYAYLQQRINASLLNYLEDTSISLKMVRQTYPVGWILLGLVFFVLILYAGIKLLYNYILSIPITATRYSKLTWGFVFFIFLGIGIFGRVGQYPLRWSDAFNLRSDYAANVALNPFQSFFSTLSFRHASYDLDKVKSGYAWMADYLQVDVKTDLNFKRTITPIDSFVSKPNVVLVICESFSGYKSSMYGNPLNTTPFFNELCKSGIFFQQAFTPTYGTARGVWATITGIPDVQLMKTASRNPSAVDQHTIINDFKGYEKFYFLGGSASWANIRGLLTNNIPDIRLYEEGNYNASSIDVWGISDKNLFLEANKILSKQQAPFFAIIQTADNHRPYTIPEEDAKEFEKRNVPLDTLKKYGFTGLDEYNAFRYTDFSYKKYFEAAQKESYFNNTVFVFIGDHGIRGDAGSMLPNVYTQQGLTAEHVPLLFYAPQILKPQRIEEVVSQIDVLPTIAGICKIKYTNSTLGRDVLSSSSLPKNQSNCAFIIDGESKKIGIIKDNLFYSSGIDNKNSVQISSLKHNNPVTLSPEQLSEYHFITTAFYETARYMLLNNKKAVIK